MDNQLIDKLKEIQNILNDKIVCKWMTIKDVCKYTKLSKSTIHRAIQKGELKCSKKTGKNLFRKEWVDLYLGI